jgi:hypothetical protein
MSLRALAFIRASGAIIPVPELHPWLFGNRSLVHLLNRWFQELQTRLKTFHMHSADTVPGASGTI